MTFDMRKRTETEFLEKFRFKVVDGGFQEGTLFTANQSISGTMDESAQKALLLLQDVESASTQVQWYSLGHRGAYKLGGTKRTILIGKSTTKEVYSKIVEGPELNVSSQFGLLLERLESLGFTPDQPDDIGSFIGLEGDGNIENMKELLLAKNPNKKVNISEKSKVFLPNRLYLVQKSASTAGVALNGNSGVILAAIEGKTEEEWLRSVKDDPGVAATGLSIVKIIGIVDELARNKKVAKDTAGRYQKV